MSRRAALLIAPLLGLLWAYGRVVGAGEGAFPQAVLAAVEGDLDFSSPLPIKGRDMVYRAEPEYKGKVIRGGITVGPEPTAVLGFAWDQKADRLYLDTNRNFDLTDDGEGHAPDQESYQWFAVFKDLRYEVHEGEARIPYRFTLRFNRTWEDRATLIVQSGWRGQLSLGDESWTVTWVYSRRIRLDQAVFRRMHTAIWSGMDLFRRMLRVLRESPLGGFRA